ncbi:MAG: SecY-interacting protein [Idiomarina sp.]
MTATSQAASTAIDNLMERYQRFYQEHQQPLLAPVVPDWECPIVVAAHSDDEVVWQPVRQAQPHAFHDLENALEQPFHQDFAVYYQRWFAADLLVTWQQHPLLLLQVMGPDDAEQLQVNMAGHILMKRRLKQPPTLFLGLADEADDLLVTMDNSTGAIGLEWVGKPQHEQLAGNLADFLNGVSPTSLT